MILGQLIL